MKHCMIIHGTEGHPKENWFPWLRAQLEERGYKVTIPQFPSPPIVPANIDEWFDVFREFETFINTDSVIIGHSLGGIFLLRILERLDHPIKAALFTGTPIGIQPIKYYDRDLAFSGFNFNWQKIKSNSGHIEVFHSDNDPFVDLANGKKLAENLGVKLHFIPNAGHFRTLDGYETFPQLLSTIDAHLGNRRSSH